jgi:tetratricopeptide (TPR) repeat protein
MRLRLCSKRNFVESIALLYAGEWGSVRELATSALAIAERNFNPQASALCRLTIAWLHVEGRDFDSAIKEAEASLSQALEANPFSFFIRRIVLAKAHLGRHDIKLALEQIAAMEEREADGVAMETPIVPHYILAQYDCCFESGDLNGALREAERLHEWAAAAPDRQFLAFALEALARVETARLKHSEAAAHLAKAIRLVRRGHFPLPARRIYAAAADASEERGRKLAARALRIRGREVTCSLANSLETDDPLRAISMTYDEPRP